MFRRSICGFWTIALVWCGAIVLAQSVDPPETIDVAIRPVDLLEPGTIIADTPPEGWSHLVVKSRPRIADEELGRVAGVTARLASFIVTGFVANVEKTPGQDRYRINGVAFGLGTRVGDKDIVLSPDTQKQLGANLGILQRPVFDIAFERQAEGKVLISAPSLVVVDTHSVFQREGRNRAVAFRYAMVLEPRSGQLTNLVWAVDRDERGEGFAIGPIEVLPASLVQSPLLYVDPNEYTLGVPSNNAYGVRRLPQGERQIPITGELERLCPLERYTVEAAARLDAALRAGLAHAVVARDTKATGR